MGGIGSGGFRENSGRKAIDGVPRSQITVTLPAWIVEKMRNDAMKNHISVSQMMTEYLEKGVSI